jgi:plastocyanin
MYARNTRGSTRHHCPAAARNGIGRVSIADLNTYRHHMAMKSVPHLEADRAAWRAPHGGPMRTFLLVLILATSLVACDRQSATEHAAVPVDESDIEIVGKRYDVRVEDTGYSPNNLQMKVGEEATLVFTRITESTCGETVVIPSIDVRRDLPVNKAVAIPFTPTTTGKIAFACGMSMMKGAIIVVE